MRPCFRQAGEARQFGQRHVHAQRGAFRLNIRKALADRIGVGGVYVGHVRRVHDLLRDRHGKRMMMWGDIILQHPDRLAEVPRDTIMLTWGYDARGSFEDQIVPFARSGLAFFICPGVSVPTV